MPLTAGQVNFHRLSELHHRLCTGAIGQRMESVDVQLMDGSVIE